MLRYLFGCIVLILGLALPVWASLPVQEVISDKGIKAWLVEDHNTPVVTLQFAFRGGVEQDQLDQQGLSVLLADLLTEGAGDLDAKTYQQTLAEHGIRFGLEASRDVISGSLYVLTAELPKAAEMARLALVAPRFDDEAIVRLKQRQKGAITARLADPEWQARRALYAHIYPNHPYAYRSLGKVASVEAITREALVATAKMRLARDNLLVAAVGDITPEALKELLDTIFGALPENAVLTEVADIAAPDTGKTLLVPQEGGQTLLLFVAPGIRRDDPDWHAAQLVNYILGGGGFESRLMSEVRDQRGLTYGIGTSLATTEHSGLIMGNARTANAKAGEAWKVTRDVWRRVHDEGVTDAELQSARDYLIGSSVTGFTSSGAIASILLSLQQDRLPMDYLDEREGLFRAVTLADAARVAKRLLDPARLTLVVTGKPEGIQPDSKEDFVND